MIKKDFPIVSIVFIGENPEVLVNPFKPHDSFKKFANGSSIHESLNNE